MNRNENQHARKPSASMFLAAVGLYALWTLTTYVLEGRNLTLLRPEATAARLLYAVIANLMVGIVGTGLLLRACVWRLNVPPARFGFRNIQRTSLSLALGLVLGFGVFVLQKPVTRDPAVLVNAMAQVLVVSVAEVLVCWVALGKIVEWINPGRRWAAVLSAWLLAAVAFGAYHIAHSPPFNSMRMVGLLTVVGLVTGAFFLIAGEVYGTILFHSLLALKGVTDALAEGGRLTHFEVLQPPLLLTALVTLALLVTMDFLVRKSPALRS